MRGHSLRRLWLFSKGHLRELVLGCHFVEQPEDLGQLVNCAKLVVFSSEGYVPQVKS